MTNIIELAKEAGFDDLFIKYGDLCLERFASLVRAEREWVDLTDDEILNLVTQYGIDDPHWFVHAVIAAFKEKNK